MLSFKGAISLGAEGASPLGLNAHLSSGLYTHSVPTPYMLRIHSIPTVPTPWYLLHTHSIPTLSALYPLHTHSIHAPSLLCTHSIPTLYPLCTSPEGLRGYPGCCLPGTPSPVSPQALCCPSP